MEKTDIVIPDSLSIALREWLGSKGVRFFRHCKGLIGEYSPVFKLNSQRKRIPVHAVHFNEGMQVRNFLRQQPECTSWSTDDFDNHWVDAIRGAVEYKEAE